MKKQIRCINCEKFHSNSKFCSRDCYFKYSMKYYTYRQKQPKYCNKCNQIFFYGWTSRKRCNDCSEQYKDWSNITWGQFRKDRPNFQAHARLRQIARTIYHRTDKPKLCTNCGYDKFYEVCHLKPIADFDESSFISDINSLDNLVALCPNCHWEYDHGLLILN